MGGPAEAVSLCVKHPEGPGGTGPPVRCLVEPLRGGQQGSCLCRAQCPGLWHVELEMYPVGTGEA